MNVDSHPDRHLHGSRSWPCVGVQYETKPQPAVLYGPVSAPSVQSQLHGEKSLGARRVCIFESRRVSYHRSRTHARVPPADTTRRRRSHPGFRCMPDGRLAPRSAHGRHQTCSAAKADSTWLAAHARHCAIHDGDCPPARRCPTSLVDPGTARSGHRSSRRRNRGTAPACRCDG